MEIGEALGLSRSPVREALKRMEAEGLVSHFPGRGTFVTDITQRDLEEIFELRIMFELHALHTACRYFDEEMLDRLEQAFLDLNENSDPQQYYDANHLLHTSIIAYGGNSRLEKFYDMLTAQFAIVNRISARDPEHFNASKKKHLNIIRALKQRDETSAEPVSFPASQRGPRPDHQGVFGAVPDQKGPLSPGQAAGKRIAARGASRIKRAAADLLPHQFQRHPAPSRYPGERSGTGPE